MAEPFKNWFNETLIRDLAKHIKLSYVDFDTNGFIDQANSKLSELELKQRSQQITEALITYLPDTFSVSCKILLESTRQLLLDDVNHADTNLNGGNQWAVMPVADYIAAKGLDNVKLSLSALRDLTSFFTSEFAIRPFLIHHPETTLLELEKWALDPNHNVRRLVSEGTRPRLPWAIQLPEFIRDPERIIPLLELLKDDESEYVRRSVANNLNDIAKDHPALVVEIAERWLIDASVDRQNLVKHACRTLIKVRYKPALSVLGFRAANLASIDFQLSDNRLDFGSDITLNLQIVSNSKTSQFLNIDYIVHHRKANGKTSPKVFKWRTVNLDGFAEINLSKKHRVKAITTRKYYPGIHRVEVVVNGDCLAETEFELVMNESVL